MDPNAALEYMRSIVRQFRDREHEDDYETLQDLVNEVSALDIWLKTGGFLPSEWDHDRTPPKRKPTSIGARVLFLSEFPFSESDLPYSAATEAAVEFIHNKLGVYHDTPVSDVFDPDDVAGGLPQTIYMSGYLQALTDLMNGDLALNPVVDSYKKQDVTNKVETESKIVKPEIVAVKILTIKSASGNASSDQTQTVTPYGYFTSIREGANGVELIRSGVVKTLIPWSRVIEVEYKYIEGA